MRINKNTVIITGGATGIGFALAKKFHDTGENRVIVASRDESSLANAKDKLKNLETVQCNVTDPKDRLYLVDKYPDVNILVNNAGIQVNGNFSKLEKNQMENEINVNFTAPVLLSKSFLPTLLYKNESAIINVSSILAILPKDSAAVYCATKAAIHSFSKSLRWQLEKTSVQVYEILPPLVDTAMTSGRGTGKISPKKLVEEFWPAFMSDKQEILIGKAKLLRILHKLFPSVAESIIRKN